MKAFRTQDEQGGENTGWDGDRPQDTETGEPRGGGKPSNDLLKTRFYRKTRTVEVRRENQPQTAGCQTDSRTCLMSDFSTRGRRTVPRPNLWGVLLPQAPHSTLPLAGASKPTDPGHSSLTDLHFYPRTR